MCLAQAPTGLVARHSGTSCYSECYITRTAIALAQRAPILGIAELMDKNSLPKAIRRLELQRSFRRRGDSRIIFTLVDARTPADCKCEPTRRLDEPFRILTRDLELDKRHDMLTSRFGPQAACWIVESAPSSTSQQD